MIERVAPWQQLVDAVDLMIGDAAEGIGQPGLRADVIRFGRFDQRVGDGGRLSAAFGAHEQPVLAPDGDGAMAESW